MDLLAYFNTVRDIEIQLLDHKCKNSKRKGDEKAKFETFFTEMYRRYAIDLFEQYIENNADYNCYVYIKKFYEIAKADK